MSSSSPGWDKFGRFRACNCCQRRTQYPVRRVHEIQKWVRSGEYDRIMSGEFRKRGGKADPRDEAADATDHYSEKFKTIFKEAGDGVGKAGDKASDAADKLSEWLRSK